jgi:hypothetical protein
MRLSASDIKDLNLLKHYRIIRKWACKNNDLTDADLELLIYLDCLGLFNKKDFELGSYSYSWDKRRWNRLLKEGWIVVFKTREHEGRFNVYKVSFKCKQLIQRIYRIMLGEEDIPINKRTNKIMKGSSYIDRVLITSIQNVNKDKDR